MTPDGSVGDEIDAGAAPSARTSTDIALVPLADGRIALQVDGTYHLVLSRNGPEDVPAWLATASAKRVVPIAGGAAYAVMPRRGRSGRASGQPARIAIVSREGQPCQEIALPVGEVVDVAVGRDGTVIGAGESFGQADGLECAWSVWPQLVP